MKPKSSIDKKAELAAKPQQIRQTRNISLEGLKFPSIGSLFSNRNTCQRRS